MILSIRVWAAAALAATIGGGALTRMRSPAPLASAGAVRPGPAASTPTRALLQRGMHEPEAMTTFIADDGSVLIPRGARATDPWSGANGWGSTHTALVRHPRNPTGSGFAIEKRWSAGTAMDAAAMPGQFAILHWASIDPAFAPVSLLYVRIRVWFSDNWPAANGDLGGMKFFYLKTSRSSANVLWTSRNPDGRLHWASITRHGAPGNFFLDTWSRGPVLLPDGEWHTIEFLFRMNSAPDAPDGRVQMWVDGSLAGDRDRVLFVGAADTQLAPDLDGIQFFPIRGSVRARLGQDDRFRLGELYVSGRR